MKPWASQLCSAAGAALFMFLVYGNVWALPLAFCCGGTASVTTRTWEPVRMVAAVLVGLAACYLISLAPVTDVSALGPIGPGFMLMAKAVALFLITPLASNAIAVILIIYTGIYAHTYHRDNYATDPVNSSDK